MASEHIYVVVTQTGTMLSRVLKLFTGAKYNHASVTCDKTMRTMYSFGRLNPYNPFFGGFVRESPHYGTFKRFRDTDAVVISLPVDEGMYEALKRDIARMYRRRKRYSYNYLGLWGAFFGLALERKNAFYCSEFVRYILRRYGVIKPDGLAGIIKPIDFLKLAGGEIVYRGKLRDLSGRMLAAPSV